MWDVILTGLYCVSVLSRLSRLVAQETRIKCLTLIWKANEDEEFQPKFPCRVLDKEALNRIHFTFACSIINKFLKYFKGSQIALC